MNEKSTEKNLLPESNDRELPALEHLRLSQNFSQLAPIEKKITTISVTKPNKQKFIRVHPDESWQLHTMVLELKETRETYLVDPSLWPELRLEIAPKRLFTAIYRENNVFIWPIRLPDADGQLDPWSESALEAVPLAIEHWIRVVSNSAQSVYEVHVAKAELPEPQWPDITFEQLIKIAFKDRFITSLDHPVLKKLRGES